MSDFRDSARRWTGAVFLGISILMVILGFTVFKSRLKEFDYIFYWLICIMFTLAAATIALLDFSSVRRNAIREQRKLIEDAIMEVEQEQEKPRKNAK